MEIIGIIKAIEFANLWALFLIPGIFIFIYLLPERDQDAAISLPMAEQLTQYQPAHAYTLNRGDLFKCMLFGLIIIASSRPQLALDNAQISRTGRDFLMLIDTSASMRTQDMLLNSRRTNRMEAVKKLTADFLNNRKGDRVGLILYGDLVVTRAPITYDLTTVGEFINNTKINDAGSKTAIGDAIGLGIKQLANSNTPNKVMLLITDGRDNVSQIPPLRAAKIAQQADITIHTIGVGAYNGPDEATLQQIAQITDGQYFRARSSSDLFAIYEQLDQIETTDQNTINIKPKKELFFWPLSLAVSLLLLWLSLIFFNQQAYKKQQENNDAGY